MVINHFFLSGMHFERLISKKTQYLIPMLPVIFLDIFYFLFKFDFLFFSYNWFTMVLVHGNLFIKTIDYWYFKMRFFVTILAIIPLFSIIFIK